MEKRLFEHINENFKARYGNYLEIKNQQALGGGCINNAFKIETVHGDFFLKWNTDGPYDLFLREADSLKAFQKSENQFITFPKPLLAKAIDELPGYMLTSFLTQGRKGNDDELLGRGLAQLHQHSAELYGFETNNYCGATLQENSRMSNWIQFYTENRIVHIVKMIKGVRSWSNNDEELLNQFLYKVPNLLNYPTKPALIHGDLWSGNYMYTSEGPALIDPCASYCDREFEMGIMTMFGGFSPTVYAAYNEFFPLENGWRERNLIYQLYHILNHYYLFGGYYKQQALEVMKKYL